MTTTPLNPQLLHLLGSRLNLSEAEANALQGGDYAGFLRERLAADSGLAGDPVFSMLASTLSAAADPPSEASDEDPAAPDVDSVDDDDTATQALAALRSIAGILGACCCWGQDASCPFCEGLGAPGYRRSRDPQLFLRWVKPTLRRMGLRLVRSETTVRTTDKPEE